jgi:serine acetyltransferase
LVNPGANLAGGVKLGKRVMIGTGAQVLQYRTVGDDAIIGAGAVVTKDVSAGVTVVGVPAKAVNKQAKVSIGDR